MSIQKSIFNFIKDGTISSENDLYYCQTRNQSTARLSKWLNEFKSLGLDLNNSAILAAIIGELTNNSFDHNLGKWNGSSGCIVGFEKNLNKIKIFIADRGQGIISSLKSVLAKNLSGDDVLKNAFEQRISGRAPEKRGNGLKFVISNIQKYQNNIFCYSQGYTYSFGKQKVELLMELPKHDFGTLIVIEWKLK